MLFVNITTEQLIEKVLELRRRTGYPQRTDGPWILLDQLTRAERSLRMRGIDPDTIGAPDDSSGR